MTCAKREDHRVDVYDRDGNKAGGRPSAEWFEMRCNLCGEVVPWKPSIRDRVSRLGPFPIAYASTCLTLLVVVHLVLPDASMTVMLWFGCVAVVTAMITWLTMGRHR